MSQTSATAPEDKNSSTNTSKDPKVIYFADAMDEAMADVAAAHESQRTGIPRGPVTGFENLDRELGGAFNQGPHSINGDPGTGKTAFTMQTATSCRYPALYVTCEMSPAELLRRHTARVTGEFLGNFKNGDMAPATARGLFQRAMATAPQFALLDATRETVDALAIQKHAVAMMKKFDSTKLLIVIDSLHSWAESFDGPEYEALNQALAAIRKLAHHLKSPVLYVTERNRESTKAGTGAQSSGAGSRKIEYGAETVISLMRNLEAKPDGRGEVDISLKLAKNRHGAVGKEIPLTFNGALQRFAAR